jgi:hypothetical protein
MASLANATPLAVSGVSGAWTDREALLITSAAPDWCVFRQRMTSYSQLDGWQAILSNDLIQTLDGASGWQRLRGFR